MRSFTIVQVKTAKSTLHYEGGRYIGDTPIQAVKKAFSKVCKNKKKHGTCSYIITIREMTQNSLKKEYTYKVTRHVDPIDVTLSNGDVITFNYVIDVKSKN